MPRSEFDGLWGMHREGRAWDVACATLRLQNVLDRISACSRRSDTVLQQIIAGFFDLIGEGIVAGEFGDELLGKPAFSSGEIKRHKAYVVSLIANGLAA